MIRVNGIDYNASVAYPAEKLVATVATDADFSTIFDNMGSATEVTIVNSGAVIASYACIFNGIEKISGGYKVTFNRAPMTVAEVEALSRTVAQQAERISAQATTISEQGTAISQQGTAISRQSETIGEHTETLENNATELDDILTAITELGDLIAELIDQGGNE